MSWLREKFFPNGFGTKMLLALTVVGAFVWVAVQQAAVTELKELATAVVLFYFTIKAANGGNQ